MKSIEQIIFDEVFSVDETDFLLEGVFSKLTIRELNQLFNLLQKDPSAKRRILLMIKKIKQKKLS